MPISSSSRSSRASASASDSPASTLPPGNSHSPPWCADSALRLTRILRCASSTTATATCNTVMPSGPVLGVDAHVVVREIGGPDHRRGRAALQFDTNHDILGRHGHYPLFLAVARGAAATLGNEYLVQVQRDLVYRQGLQAGPANCREQPAPVGIGREQGCFH